MSAKRWIAIVMTTLLAAPVLAQDQGGQGGQNRDRGGDRGGDRGNRGGGDPAQFRERFETTVKERLGATDDEWKVIQPKLTKVFDAQRALRGGFGGGLFRRGGGGGDNNNENPNRSPLETAQRDLSQLLENKDASADQIAAKLKALRDARDKARAELVTAQKDLKEILTPRQEAVLVSMSMLD